MWVVHLQCKKFYYLDPMGPSQSMCGAFTSIKLVICFPICVCMCTVLKEIFQDEVSNVKM